MKKLEMKKILGIFGLIIIKLNFSAYLGVIAVIYNLIIITIQCDTYWNHYKKNEYVEDDKSTHVNLTHLEKAFTSDLDFFEGMGTFFHANTCITGIFPVNEGFKYHKMVWIKCKNLFFSVCLTTALHVISITCFYLTEPIYPEDVIIYRKPKEHNDKIF